MPNLAISLHAPTDEQRGRLVPLNRKYGVEDVIAACKRFPLKKRSRITFEYVLLAQVNEEKAKRDIEFKIARLTAFQAQGDATAEPSALLPLRVRLVNPAPTKPSPKFAP